MDWPSDGPRLTALVEPVTPGVARRIVNDAFIALRAGTSESWGIAVIAGTGTVAVGRDPVGNEFRTIGEGRVFGDFGDEFDVSELAVARGRRPVHRPRARHDAERHAVRAARASRRWSRCSSGSLGTIRASALPSCRT